MLQVQIADIVIRVILPNWCKNLKLSEEFCKFKISDLIKEDVIVNVDEIDDFYNETFEKNYVFKLDNEWAISRGNNELTIIDYTYSNSEKNICRIGIFNQNFNKGKIVINKKCVSLDIYTTVNNNLFSLNPLTYPIGTVFFSEFLADNRGIILHASGIWDNNYGYIFCGYSGAGKSTMAKLWEKEAKAIVLNDDRIIVRCLEDKGSSIYGVPWYATLSKLVSSKKVKLDKIFFIIEHSKKNYARLFNPVEAESFLTRHCYLPIWDKKGVEFSLSFIHNLANEIPCYGLGFVPDKGVIDFIRDLDRI